MTNCQTLDSPSPIPSSLVYRVLQKKIPDELCKDQVVQALIQWVKGERNQTDRFFHNPELWGEGIMVTYSKRRAQWSCQEGTPNQSLCEWSRWWASFRELGFSLWSGEAKLSWEDANIRSRGQQQYRRNWALLGAGNGIRYVPNHTEREREWKYSTFRQDIDLKLKVLWAESETCISHVLVFVDSHLD